MELLVVLEQDEETGDIVAEIPQLPGCHTQGRTKEEAMRNIREAAELYLQVDPEPPARVIGVERIHIPG